MPVRFRITLLFTIIAMCIVVIVGATVYTISFNNRIQYIKTRLTNRAITTGRLLATPETFNSEAIRKIDALTATALKQKTVQAYDQNNRRIYSFSDSFDDTIHIAQNIFQRTRSNKVTYFVNGSQDVVAYHFNERGNDIVIVSAAYDETGSKNLEDLLFVLSIAGLTGVVLSFASGYFFSRKLLYPIAKITNQVNEISAQNLRNRIPTGNVKDEWFELTDTLNSLLNRLQDSFETQRRFVSNASHELSTPLTSISSQIQVCLQKDREPAAYRQVMTSVYQDVQHMSRLTKTLLEIAKTSGDAGGLELNQVRIDEVLLKLPAALQKINPEYNVSLEFDNLPEDEQALYVFGNEDLLFTAVKNIAANACKYADDKRCKVALIVSQHSVTIHIDDNGKGIAEQEVKRIFEPFYRSPDAKTTEGFGLGLSLSLRIIKIHKGTLDVNSAPGQGSRFTITLPSSKWNKKF